MLCGAASHSITIFAPAALDPQISQPHISCIPKQNPSRWLLLLLLLLLLMLLWLLPLLLALLLAVPLLLEGHRPRNDTLGRFTRLF